MRARNWLRSATLIYFLIAIFCGYVRCVAIRELKVPQLVELSPEDILLDCDFDYEENEKLQLDIKWYFNDEPSPFYQWVPARMAKPQLIGDRFRGHIDLDHKLVHIDEFIRHRALLIKRPTIELSGTYTCKVSTFVDEDVQRKQMTIFSPATTVTFQQQMLPSSDQVNVSCAATGVYPQPQIKLLRGSFQLDDSEASVTNNVGYFDIIVHRVVDHAEIPPTTKFGCELTIPGTDYRVKEESVYNHGHRGGGSGTNGGRYSHHAAFASKSSKTSLDSSLMTSLALLASAIMMRHQQQRHLLVVHQ